MNSKGSRIQGFKDSSEFNALDPLNPRILEPCLRGQDGFTAIEVTMIVVVLAILAFSIGIKMDITGTQSAVAADQLITDIRYVQMKSVSIGKPYKITFAGNSYTISSKDNSENETKKLPGNETAAADICTTLIFNTLGEPEITADCTITLSGGSKVKVFNITGKAEPTS